jgi:hypothetical protein
MTGAETAAGPVTTLQLLGTGSFGAVVGWYVYYINRHRKDAIQISDILTLIGAIGGAAILSLFEKGTALFGAYGVGLGTGFFGYFVFLLIFVALSRKRFHVDWFLDGRRKDPETGWGYPGGGTGPVQTPMWTRSRLLVGGHSRLALSAKAAVVEEPIVEVKTEIRRVSNATSVSVQVVIGNAQPGSWQALLDGVVVGSASDTNRLQLPAPLQNKVLEVSAAMKAEVTESKRLSLLVSLFDAAGAPIGGSILIDRMAETGDSAAYSIIVVFVEGA